MIEPIRWEVIIPLLISIITPVALLINALVNRRAVKSKANVDDASSIKIEVDSTLGRLDIYKRLFEMATNSDEVIIQTRKELVLTKDLLETEIQKNDLREEAFKTYKVDTDAKIEKQGEDLRQEIQSHLSTKRERDGLSKKVTRLTERIGRLENLVRSLALRVGDDPESLLAGLTTEVDVDIHAEVD